MPGVLLLRIDGDDSPAKKKKNKMTLSEQDAEIKTVIMCQPIVF